MTRPRRPTSPNGLPRPTLGEGPRALPKGVATTFEFCIRFHDWASSLKQPLTAQAIKERWGVSQATAYRYLNAYRAAKGGDK